MVTLKEKTLEELLANVSSEELEDMQSWLEREWRFTYYAGDFKSYDEYKTTIIINYFECCVYDLICEGYGKKDIYDSVDTVFFIRELVQGKGVIV